MNKGTIDKHEAILSAALEVFAEYGFHGASISLIAKEAGVGAGTIYRYFQSKNDLIEAIHEQVRAVFVQVFGDSYRLQAPVRQNFIDIFTGMTKLFIASPAKIKFMEQYYNSPYGVAKKRAGEIECDRPLMAFFDQGKEQQVIKDLPFEILFGLTFGPVLMLVREHLRGFVNLDDAAISTVLGSCWEAIKH